jgi:hypothetical protein
MDWACLKTALLCQLEGERLWLVDNIPNESTEAGILGTVAPWVQDGGGPTLKNVY